MLMREPEAGLVLCAALLSSAGGMDVDLPANTEWELLRYIPLQNDMRAGHQRIQRVLYKHSYTRNSAQWSIF